MIVETKKRSLAKALSWRFFATFITTIVVWMVTNEPTLSIGIGVSDSVIKLAAYYGHERLWNRLTFGLVKPSPNKGLHGDGI